MSYSEKIACQLVRQTGSPPSEVTAHMWQECERIASGFYGHENDYGVRYYSSVCDHLAERRERA